MGWRFRKSFSPLPGVRLNFSPGGISTSVGAGPFRFYVGSQGAAVTARIPGTGISYRQPLHLSHSTTVPAPHASTTQTAHPTPHPTRPQITPPSGTQIHSASTSTLTTQGLAPIKELLTKAHKERSSLLPELREAQQDATRLKTKHQHWSDGWLFRRLFKRYFVRLGERVTEAADKHAELEEQERLSRLATDFDLPDNLKDYFGRLCDSVAALAGSQRIWDAVSSVGTDAYHERTAASQRFQRQAVRVSLGNCDLIQSTDNVPHLMNANGGEMFLYPAFILYFISQQAFALIDIREVTVKYSPLSFIEQESVPTDAELICHTWKKANKDGSPDRRFANNYQIPVLKYGYVRLTSQSGLNEAYIISNACLAEAFAQAFAGFQRALAVATA